MFPFLASAEFVGNLHPRPIRICVLLERESSSIPENTRLRVATGNHVGYGGRRTTHERLCTSGILLVALLVAVRFWIWCASMRNDAFARVLESRARSEVLRNCALRCVSVLVGLEWIKRALLCQLSYAPTS